MTTIATKSGKPLLQLTIYYLVVFVLISAAVHFFPAIRQYLPLGGIESLKTGVSELMSGQRPLISWDPVQKSIHLALSLLVVEPECHGMGFGKALMDKARALHGDLEVEVFKANAIGRAFYARYGFELIEEKDDEDTGHRMLRLRFLGSE